MIEGTAFIVTFYGPPPVTISGITTSHSSVFSRSRNVAADFVLLQRAMASTVADTSSVTEGVLNACANLPTVMPSGVATSHGVRSVVTFSGSPADRPAIVLWIWVVRGSIASEAQLNVT